MIIWRNGDYGPADQAVSAMDRGFLLGDGAFETLCVTKGVPEFWAQHMARLQYGLACLSMPALTLEDIGTIIRELTARNGLGKRCVMRITVTRGAAGRGLTPIAAAQIKPTVVISLSDAPPLLMDKAADKVIGLHIAEARIFSKDGARGFKSLSGYGANIRARYEAAAAGCDEALVFNEQDNIVCASAANVFHIDEGRVLTTPPLSDGALPGIVRGVLIKAAGGAGWRVEEASLSLEQVQKGGLFLTNSLLGLAPAAIAAPYRQSQALALREATLKKATVKKAAVKKAAGQNSFVKKAIEELRELYHTALQQDLSEASVQSKQ